MKLCRTCRYGSEYELDKPCIVYREDCPMYQKEGDEMTREEAIEVIKQDIPCEYDTDLIEALDMAIQALEQEPSGDAISRQIISDYVQSHIQEINTGYGDLNKHTNEILRMIVDYIETMSSGKPQKPKTGHWIAYEVQLPDRTILNYRCSVCGRKLIGYNTKTLSEAPFCHCGAKMIEPQESDHKCHTCKHYMSGDYDGSCDNYVCNGYSDWESDNCN